jgi:agmatinase
MPQILTVPPRRTRQSFMDFEIVSDLESLDANVAILGVPYSDPYSIDQVTNDQTNAPTAIRRASTRSSGGVERWDFDLGGPIFDGKNIRVVDCGDVPGVARDLNAHYGLAEQAARQITTNGTLLITLGGDHGVPIPILRGLDAHGPITLVQIDAHLDWIDVRNGVREGYSSPIRRASEMEHIGEIFQIGLRCQGSAQAADIAAARAYGSHLITDMELQDSGIDAVLEKIPAGGNTYLTIDADGMDPSAMPAVDGPAPGGATYHQVRKLIQGLAAKTRVLGMDIVEITPKRDVNEITAITAGNLIINMIGSAVRAGYFD